jgi:hypothetical protein
MHACRRSVLQSLRPGIRDMMTDTVIGDHYGGGVLESMIGEHIEGVDKDKQRRLEATLAVSTDQALAASA